MLPAEVKRHRFTVEEYDRMVETGLLSEGDRVELVVGAVAAPVVVDWAAAGALVAAWRLGPASMAEVLSGMPRIRISSYRT